MDFILTDTQKAITGLTIAFIIIPGIVAYGITKLVNYIPTSFVEKVL
jgi:hypothetical protein